MDIEELEKIMKKDVGEAKKNEGMQVICETEVCNYKFKIYGTKEEPLFLAKDIECFLEYKGGTTQLVGLVDEDEKVLYNVQTLRGIQESWFVNKDGLFEILMLSRKPVAKQFKKGVKQILKQIESTGGYVVEHREEEFIENHYDFLSSETKNAMLSEMREHIKKQNAIIEEQNKKILLDAPKVDYHDNVLNCDKLISVNEIANDIGISAKALNQFLHDEGIQYKQGKSWKIYSKHYDLITDKYCDYHITEYGQQLKWTEKGRKFILELYYSKNEK